MEIPEADAEELASDVLMKVYNGVGTFHTGRAKLTTWIFQIAHNLAIDFHRVQHEEHEELPEDIESVGASRKPAGRNTAYLAWLSDELAKLPPEDQRLLLDRANGRSYAEIAVELKTNVNTLRVRHKRALGKLSSAADHSELTGVIAAQNPQESGVEHE